jgi:hypothetical protein
MCFAALIGAATDYGMQVAVNYASGNENPWTDIDAKSILVSAGSAAFGTGLVSNANKLAKGMRAMNRARAARATAVVGETTGDAAANIAQQLLNTGEVDAKQIVVAVTVGQVIRSPIRDDIAGGRAQAQNNLDRSASKAKRVASNAQGRANPSNSRSPVGRQSKANRLTTRANQSRSTATSHASSTVRLSVGTAVGASGTASRLVNSILPPSPFPVDN